MASQGLNPSHPTPVPAYNLTPASAMVIHPPSSAKVVMGDGLRSTGEVDIIKSIIDAIDPEFPLVNLEPPIPSDIGSEQTYRFLTEMKHESKVRQLKILMDGLRFRFKYQARVFLTWHRISYQNGLLPCVVPGHGLLHHNAISKSIPCLAAVGDAAVNDVVELLKHFEYAADLGRFAPRVVFEVTSKLR
ncbi:Nn.00g017930.m01.CDS01 [Neocucurbitaria sp. VM-36]